MQKDADALEKRKRDGIWSRIKVLSFGPSSCFKSLKSPKSSEGSHDLPHQAAGNDASPRRRRFKRSISKLSTASSHRSYYTAEGTLFGSRRSSRFDEQTLAELDALGEEADEREKLGTSKRHSSLPAVSENDPSSHQNGSAYSTSGAVPTSAVPLERQSFLDACDDAQLKVLNRLHKSGASCVADVALLPVAPWNQRSGFLGYLSRDEEDSLRQMRTWFPESRKWHTDHDILRFLRARGFALGKTKELYLKYINDYRASQMTSVAPVVRESHGPFDSDLFKLFPERDSHITEQMQKLKDHFLHTAVFNLDKEGRPVVYFRPANIVKNSMNKYVALKYRIAFQSAANEGILLLAKMASHKVGYQVENTTQILDLAGMSALAMLSHMRAEESQAEWQHNMDFQPEVLHKIYIINAPTGMSAVWKFASFFVPAETRSKVEVLGTNFLPTLEKVIGKDSMPTCYGGTVPFEWQEHKSVKGLKPLSKS